jgi:DNA-binding transcriptional LysR family regulator
MDDPLVVLTRRDSPLMSLKRPTFDALDGADVVAWTKRWPMQLELEEAWRRRGIAPRIVYRNLALQRLVAAGLGHACIGRLAARNAIDSALTWIDPDEELLVRRIVLLSPRHRELGGAALTLIDAIRVTSGVAGAAVPSSVAASTFSGWWQAARWPLP